MHAVYPSIAQEQLVKMTIDQIIARDPSQSSRCWKRLLLMVLETGITKILGATKSIVARDSKTFAKEIGKYIDSKGQKRGNKKDKKKPKEKSLMDQVREAAGMSTEKSKEKKDDADGPALWPLIRQVNVRCPSTALSTGAVLVDLPGMQEIIYVVYDYALLYSFRRCGGCQCC